MCVCIVALRRRCGRRGASATTATTSLLARAEPAATDEMPNQWLKLDRRGRRVMQQAEVRLARTTPLGIPVGQSPAGVYVGVCETSRIPTPTPRHRPVTYTPFATAPCPSRSGSPVPLETDWQYGACHPVAAMQLECSALDDTSGAAQGGGFDDIGTFNAAGEYKNNKLALTKQYVRGTGNARENRGHAVALRLTCCELSAALPERAAELESWGMPSGTVGFYGTWHVRTRSYSGDAEMVLWLPPVTVVTGYLIQKQLPVAQPVVAQPVVAQPIVAQPIVAQLPVAQPIVAQLPVAQPVVAQPIVAQPAAVA